MFRKPAEKLFFRLLKEVITSIELRFAAAIEAHDFAVETFFSLSPVGLRFAEHTARAYPRASVPRREQKKEAPSGAIKPKPLRQGRRSPFK